MSDIEVDDEVGWHQNGVDYVGFVISEPNDMGEFYINVEDEAGHAETRVLDALTLPDGFINYRTAALEEYTADTGEKYARWVDDRGVTHELSAQLNPDGSWKRRVRASYTKPDQPTVISKPQKQSLWPYVLFMVAGGALILNI